NECRPKHRQRRRARPRLSPGSRTIHRPRGAPGSTRRRWRAILGFGSTAGRRKTMTSRVAGRMAEAANTLIESLDQAQRKVACRPFPDDAERRLWYYTPTDHGGLPLAAMGPIQQRNVHRLVATGLSTPGYVTVAAIIGLENILDQLEGWSVDFGRERGRDPTLYYVTIFGEPGGDAPWGWRF